MTAPQSREHRDGNNLVPNHEASIQATNSNQNEQARVENGTSPSQTSQDNTHTTSQAWLQVLLSHLINFNSFGFMLSFGIFQSHYLTFLSASPSSISWIGTLQLFFNFFIGIFSGRAMDAGFYQYTLSLGVALQLLGVFGTSFSTTYWQIFLAQGVCQGIGNGLLFCPAVALVSGYFPQRGRALAVSFVACGGATGGMVFPAIAQSLLPRLGFAWTVRVMGFVMLGVSVPALLFSRPKVVSWKKMGWIDRSAFSDLPYLTYCVGIFFGFWGLFFAYYYVRPYGREILYTSQKTSFNLLLVINSFGIPGRIIPNVLSDRYFGPLPVIIPFIFISGILLFAWIGVHNITSFYIWTAIYGFFAGGCQSLFQASSSNFSNDPQTVGVRIGMVCTIVSFACLSGPPIAGLLIERGGYRDAQLFGGCVMVGGSMLLFAASVLQKRTRKIVNTHEP